MEVTLLSHTKDIESLIAAAARTCYSPLATAEIAETIKVNRPEQNQEFIQRLRDMGHESPLEHVSFTFGIDGVSRALTHQLVRHRVASYCVTGDTIISSYKRNKRHSARKRSIKQIYEWWNSSRNKHYVKAMEIRSMDNNRTIIPAKIKNVFCNGEKQVYKLTTESGRSIKCTDNHQFLNENDEWVELCNLQPGMKIQVNGKELLQNRDWIYHNYIELNKTRAECASLCECCEATFYKTCQKLGIKKPHSMYSNRQGPSLGSMPLRGPVLREKYRQAKIGSLNPSYKPNRYNLTESGKLSECNRLYDLTNEICEFCGAQATERHHISKDRTDSSRKNVKFLCSACHHLWHHSGSIGSFLDKIVSIEKLGIEMVYDIEVDNEFHNFIANGIVVHNSQQSQRYVAGNKFSFVTPHSIQKNADLQLAYSKFLMQSMEVYEALVANGVPKEDARYVLPNATTTNIVVTMNVRELLHFFSVRCCMRAQWEIRELAWKMLAICKEVSPTLFNGSGAFCDQKGYCKEGAMSCGRCQTLESILKNKEETKHE